MATALGVSAIGVLKKLIYVESG